MQIFPERDALLNHHPITGPSAWVGQEAGERNPSDRRGKQSSGSQVIARPPAQTLVPCSGTALMSTPVISAAADTVKIGLEDRGRGWGSRESGSLGSRPFFLAQWPRAENSDMIQGGR